MRHPMTDMRKLMYSIPQKAKDETGNITEEYGEKIDFLAVVTPTQAGLIEDLYGNRNASEYRMYGAPAGIAEGCAIWLDAPTDGAPDYEVTSVVRHPRERVLTIKRRGVVGG